jgi:hypothetical protein
MKTLSAVAVVFALSAVVALSSCDLLGDANKADGGLGTGPIDGVWTLQSMTCDGVAQDLGSTSFKFTITNIKGVMADSHDSCTRLETVSIEYPAAGKIKITHDGDKQCDGSCTSNTGSQNDCSASTGNGDIEEHDYSMSGNTLKISNVSEGGDEDCPAGQTTEFTLTK